MRPRTFAVFLAAILGLGLMGTSVLGASERQDELAAIRAATAAFHDVDAAKAAGYELGYVNGSGVRIITGCVAHPTAGAMGYHYFNKALIDDLQVDVLRPEGLVYAPGPEGTLQLSAVEYVVPGPELQSPRPRSGTVGPGIHDAHPRPGGGLLHPPRVAVAAQPGRDVRGLEPRGQLRLGLPAKAGGHGCPRPAGFSRAHGPGARLLRSSPVIVWAASSTPAHRPLHTERRHNSHYRKCWTLPFSCPQRVRWIRPSGCPADRRPQRRRGRLAGGAHRG